MRKLPSFGWPEQLTEKQPARRFWWSTEYWVVRLIVGLVVFMWWRGDLDVLRVSQWLSAGLNGYIAARVWMKVNRGKFESALKSSELEAVLLQIGWHFGQYLVGALPAEWAAGLMTAAGVIFAIGRGATKHASGRNTFVRMH